MAYIFATLLLIAPLYVWRFSIGGLPTNFLMIAGLAFICVLKFKMWQDHNWSMLKMIATLKAEYSSMGRPLVIGLGMVSLASVISLVIFGLTAEKLAQWLVLYLIPISIFILIRNFSKRDVDVLRYVVIATYILLLGAGVIALLQYTTLQTLPTAWTGNANEPKRAIAFFAHPNAYALFVTPLLAWLIPDAVKRAQSFWNHNRKVGMDLFLLVAWLVGAMGMFLTLSRGAWIGIVVAAGVYVLLSANKKMFLIFSGLLVAGILLVASVPNLRYRVILPFYGEKSAVARLSLWHTGSAMLTDAPPTSVIFGKGINGFSENWEKFNTDPNLQHYNFPHNVFLNFWVDLGLMGLLGLIIIMAAAVWRGIAKRKNPVALGLLLFITALVVHGLIDIPYLKNDLALVFWMMLGLSYNTA